MAKAGLNHVSSLYGALFIQCYVFLQRHKRVEQKSLKWKLSKYSVRIRSACCVVQNMKVSCRSGPSCEHLCKAMLSAADKGGRMLNTAHTIFTAQGLYLYAVYRLNWEIWTYFVDIRTW